MLKVRKSNERGHAEHGWLNSYHTFSFASYYDPQQMGFSDLRVINEDRIEGGTGFGTHGHQDMEIISYVIDGALEHRDSMGNSTIIRPGEVQIMSAGTGIRHSEMNHLPEQETHFLQIWVMPNRKGLTPSYGQKSFEPQLQKNKPVLVLSPDGRDESLKIHQDVLMYACQSQDPGEFVLKTAKERHVWVQVLSEGVEVNGTPLENGDGVALNDVDQIQLQWKSGGHFLVFDLPA